MVRTAAAPEATRETVQRLLRLAEVARLMGDMPRAASLAADAERLWRAVPPPVAPRRAVAA